MHVQEKHYASILQKYKTEACHNAVNKVKWKAKTIKTGINSKRNSTKWQKLSPIKRFLKLLLHKYQTFPKEKCLTWANVCHLKNDEFF